MFRLFHSSDWQLGVRFAQFGSSGGQLCEVWLEKLKHSLESTKSTELRHSRLSAVSSRATKQPTFLLTDNSVLPQRHRCPSTSPATVRHFALLCTSSSTTLLRERGPQIPSVRGPSSPDCVLFHRASTSLAAMKALQTHSHLLQTPTRNIAISG